MENTYKPFIKQENSDFNITKLSLSKTTLDEILRTGFTNPITPNPSNIDDSSESSFPETSLSQARKILYKSEHQYKDSNINVGNVKTFLDKASEYGISFRITSGERPDAKTSSGKRSRHDGASAIDITPIEGETYEELYDKIRNSPLLDYMVENNIGFLEERSKEDQRKYGATASNIHISVPDASRPYGEKAAIESRKRLLGA
jgi:hypothetical protein